MKLHIFFLSILLIPVSLIANIRDPHEGGICHVEAEYFYPGIWEKYGENELICNYWQFLGDEGRQVLESQLSGAESEAEYGDYDSLNEMDEE
ncbi:hypothetical protein BKG93_05350 [Rodentibacter ratti]|uniref:Uncharacterized protein n=2 Tax=Rodentibacter TaxID=1960084 RepID=A0A1V3L5B4_9PAST|nr:MULTISPECIES: hypothetical protein [Rodentibacter]OOF77039.1 hypothetical protein BKG96_09110 [Rodentibacter heylii]OOF85154.1 hypothetical protein BKG93_05350 [Rodentibacter ratti]QIA76767.1 hypothetical protein FEE42_05040 [Rodentibacter heylii]